MSEDKLLVIVARLHGSLGNSQWHVSDVVWCEIGSGEQFDHIRAERLIFSYSLDRRSRGIWLLQLRSLLFRQIIQIERLSLIHI